MMIEGSFTQRAFEYAGALGRFQGLVSFLRSTPDFYSREELVEQLIKLDDEVQERLDALEAVDEQE